jgi:protein-disulfide isomerase
MTQEDRPTLSAPVGAQDHTAGPANAPVTLIEYGDFECPFCKMDQPVVREIRRRLGDRLRFVWRHFSRPEHPHARQAAEAAEAASVQGRFWEFSDRLFERQEALEEEHLVGYAGELGLDVDRFRTELSGHHYTARVQQDVLSGIHSGVHGTPTFFINGVRHEGDRAIGPLLAAIEAAEQGAR